MLNEILYLNPSRQHNNIGVNGYGTEADNMMVLAKRVKGKLDMMGILKKIVLTEGLTLAQAIAESNAVGATLHLDMHSDADGDNNSKTGFGCTGIYKSDKGKQFISCIYKHVSALTPTYDRGLSYRTDLGALNQTRAVAGLIECFFHDNTDDVAFYEAHVDALAQAIVSGILEYFGVSSVPVAAAPAPQTPPVASIAPNVDALVVRLQRNLNRLWFTDDSGQTLVEDGLMGARTKQAVKKFQKVASLTVDGIAGMGTWNALNVILSKPLCRHDKFNRVATRYIQWRLGANADGIYGTNTIGHVKSYQMDMGLTPDGIFGQASWQKLIG